MAVVARGGEAVERTLEGGGVLAELWVRGTAADYLSS